MEKEIEPIERGENMGTKKGEIAIYKAKSGNIYLDVILEKETVWLSQAQIARLFNTQRPAITKHLSNIFKNKELDKNSVCSILEHTARDGKHYSTMFYNLDAIISVGYRINSNQATQFRIWATKVLKNYLIKGYALNQKRLHEHEAALKELRETITFIGSKASHPQLAGKADDLLKLLNEYSNALTILHEYDNKSLSLTNKIKPKFVLGYDMAVKTIDSIKKRLADKKEAGDLFGREVSQKFKSIIGAIYQTFDKKDLYASVEEKAAHILYLTIKDHPFSDGNKRIASIMFIYYLENNACLYKTNGERKINDSAIVALALLIASSDPREKGVMIKIITNLLRG
ncbi:MAG: virulence protein RhuM/Fic/DOC family protein [Candidatus Omnitrophota bacterium]